MRRTYLTILGSREPTSSGAKALSWVSNLLECRLSSKMRPYLQGSMTISSTKTSAYLIMMTLFCQPRIWILERTLRSRNWRKHTKMSWLKFKNKSSNSSVLTLIVNLAYWLSLMLRETGLRRLQSCFYPRYIHLLAPAFLSFQRAVFMNTNYLGWLTSGKRPLLKIYGQLRAYSNQIKSSISLS